MLHESGLVGYQAQCSGNSASDPPVRQHHSSKYQQSSLSPFQHSQLGNMVKRHVGSWSTLPLPYAWMPPSTATWPRPHLGNFVPKDRCKPPPQKPHMGAAEAWRPPWMSFLFLCSVLLFCGSYPRKGGHPGPRTTAGISSLLMPGNAARGQEDGHLHPGKQPDTHGCPSLPSLNAHCRHHKRSPATRSLRLSTASTEVS